MIKLFKGVLVIRLWKWNRLQVELCVFPPHKTIAPHKHDWEDIELMHLWGQASYYRYEGEHSNARSYWASAKDTFRQFTIPASSWHGATVGKWGLITLSIQRWYCDPSSVTEDFIEKPLIQTTH